MGKNTSIALGDHFESFISKSVKSGQFNSASEVVRAGLRLLEEEEKKKRLLTKALIDGNLLLIIGQLIKQTDIST